MKKSFENDYIGVDNDVYPLLYHKKGEYSVTFSICNNIPKFSADKDSYYKTHNTYDNIFKMLGFGYAIQKIDVIANKFYKGETDRKDYLSKKHFENFKGRKYKQVITYLVITRKNIKKSFFQYNEKEHKDFLTKIEKAESILISSGFKPEVLGEAELKAVCQKIGAFDFTNDKAQLKNFKVTDEQILVGKKSFQSLSLIDIDDIMLPKDISPTSVLNLGYDYPQDLFSFLYDVPNVEFVCFHQYIEIPDQRKTIIKLEAKKKKHESMPDPANVIAAEHITKVLDLIAKQGELLVYCHYNVSVFGESSSISQATNFIESELFNIGIIPSSNSYNQLELYKSIFPGHSFDLKEYDKFLTTSDPAIALLFSETDEPNDDSDYKIYFSDRRGIPRAMDLSDLPMQTGQINNRNKFVLGPSGSGKSFFMNFMVKQYYEQDTDIVIVDKGHSYSGLCKYVGGEYITYTEENPITMNPFDIQKEEFNLEKKDFLRALIGLCWKGADGNLSQIEDTIILQVLGEYYFDYFGKREKVKSTSFNSWYEFSVKRFAQIAKQESIQINVNDYAFILKKFYADGQYGTILNNDMENSLFDQRFIVFEIDNISGNKVLFPITTLIIMDVFIQKMRLKSSRKALIIEEAWKAIASPMMANYILYLYKTVRKFWGEAIVVTQELSDILSNEIVKDSILANSDSVILLDQSKFRKNYESVAKLLSLDEVEQSKIFTINQLDNKNDRGRFKEAYIKLGDRGSVVGVEPCFEEYLTYTTERKEKDAVAIYLEIYDQYDVAIDNFVADMKAYPKGDKRFFEALLTTYKSYMSIYKEPNLSREKLKSDFISSGMAMNQFLESGPKTSLTIKKAI